MDFGVTKKLEDSILKIQIETVALRIKSLMDGGSLRSFANKVGISEGALRKILKGSIPNIETAAKIAIFCDVSLDWLIMGMENGINSFQELKVDLNEEKNTPLASQLHETKEIPKFTDEYHIVPGYDYQVFIDTGKNTISSEPNCHHVFHKTYLENRKLNSEHCLVITVSGDSMGDTILNNDLILVDTASKTPIDGHIYVVRLGNELYAKRIQKKYDGSLLLISDNHKYKPVDVPKECVEELYIVGKVVQRSTDM